MQTSSEGFDEHSKSSSKQPVVRNARACTVCRAAKMKCVGAEDGEKPCQRCRRTNSECVFEKHRRGRKPGSKLSEASKMLRRLEKGLNAAKLKQINETPTTPVYTVDSRSPQTDSSFGGSVVRPDQYGSSAKCPPDGDEEEDGDRSDEKFPAKMIRRENSFFKTILNPEHKSPYHTAILLQAGNDPNHQQSRPSSLLDGCDDPITTGLITEEKARIIFDLIMLRLNPFINLFDPALHSVDYVRSKSPFLFTALMMAGCKFFEPNLYKDCLRLAHELALCAFSKAWKGVEVVQAFACMTYWREQEDNCTWTYIGYACRMAVELGLNRFVAKPPPNETEFQLRERRNRERTYLVLFIHDRSLSIQTGRHWMLPEDELIRHSDTWHLHGSASTRCHDVVVAAFAQLRRTAAETTDKLTGRSLNSGGNGQVDIDAALNTANYKLSQWWLKWEREMQKANGEPFHFSFIHFFQLYTSLFLNSFGVQDNVPQANRKSNHSRALSACFDHAMSVLRIASKDFRELGVLQYGQETATVMTAYSAIMLLRLLRSSSNELPDGAANDIYDTIARTAEAYNAAAQLSPTSSTASYHARFLWHLIRVHRTRSSASQERTQQDLHLDPTIQRPTTVAAQPPTSPPDDLQVYYPVRGTQEPYPQRDQPNGASIPFVTSNRGGPAPAVSNMNMINYTTADDNYYRMMLFHLGLDESVAVPPNEQFRNPSYTDSMNGHYTQYTYPHTQILPQNDFVGN